MPDELFEEASQHRINRRRSTIASDDGTLTFDQEEKTEISPDGNIITTVTDSSVELDGEIIRDISTQIVGRCQIPECRQYLTKRTIRLCSSVKCTKTLCHHCAKYDEKENDYFCRECHKQVKIKRMLLGTLRVILSPFVERVEE
ncbi:MAG: hypothetical protein KAR42_13760 [candidate division Zixibacteria bacterium]|nr:hypothetical protein [candidate division Zixibacteria bacterium]